MGILLTVTILAAFLSIARTAKEGITDSLQTQHHDESEKVTLSPLLSTLLPASESITALALTTENESDFKVVCYLSDQKWDPNKINKELCSHIVYIDVATLDDDSLLIKQREISPDFQERIALLKKKGIKVSVAIGGWDDSWGNKYSRLVASSSNRAAFVTDIVDFLEKTGFDGLELQWQYPSCWQGRCWSGPKTDKPGFTNLIKELHDAFKPKGLLLSAYVSPLQDEIDHGYDVPEISKYVDWLAVMCHSYHGYWNGITGHVAPMYAQPHDHNDKYNTNFSINYWIEKGADRKKILMTMPMFGRTYLLSDSKENGLGQYSDGAGEGKGAIPYSKICENIIEKGYTMVSDEEYRVGPYAYLDDQWVSFDDVHMVKYKSEYIRGMGLGGAMIWSLDFEDINNACKCESYPLLKEINRVLRNYPEPDKRCYLEIDNNVR